MSIMGILLVLLVAGILAWGFTKIMNAPGIVIAEPFRTIIYVVGIVLLCLFVLQAIFGVVPGMPKITL